MKDLTYKQYVKLITRIYSEELERIGEMLYAFDHADSNPDFCPATDPACDHWIHDPEQFPGYDELNDIYKKLNRDPDADIEALESDDQDKEDEVTDEIRSAW
jgi:hypothetical protein